MLNHDEDDLEITLGRGDAANPRVLVQPSRQIFGTPLVRIGGAQGPTEIIPGSPDAAYEDLKLRVGRRPIARSLSSMYCEGGRELPQEYEVFWGHELWLVEHSVGVVSFGSGTGMKDHVEQLCVEVAFPDDVTVVEVLPQPKFVSSESSGGSCDADIGLNGRASVPSVPVSRHQTATSNDERPRGARLALHQWQSGVQSFGAVLDAPGLKPPPVVCRVSFEMLTSDVQAIGIGHSAAEYVFSRSRVDRKLVGNQLMAEVVLVDKHETTLNCTARVQAVVAGLNDVPTRLRSDWIPITIKL